MRAKCHYFSVQTSSLGSLRRKRREKRTVSNYTSGPKVGGKENEIRATRKWQLEFFSPFSIWLMQSERILPELFKLQGPFLHQPWCPESLSQSSPHPPSLSLGGLFNGAYVWVNGQIRLLEESADPPLFPLTLPSFLSRDWRLEEGGGSKIVQKP